MPATPVKPPSPAELFRRYLQEQADAQSLGLGIADSTGDVVPHDAVPVQPIDPKQAWEDAVGVLAYFPSIPKVKLSVPPDWSALVSGQEPAVALAFCLGNTPQLVRELQPLLNRTDLVAPRGGGGSGGNSSPGLREWAAGTKDGAKLLAAGVLRLAREFDQAATLLQEPPVSWSAVAANELAAIAWHRGKPEEAVALWNKQEESTPVLFNRGMAALFLGDATSARKSLAEAVSAIAETSPWHHLGRLYLALAEGR